MGGCAYTHGNAGMNPKGISRGTRQPLEASSSSSSPNLKLLLRCCLQQPTAAPDQLSLCASATPCCHCLLCSLQIPWSIPRARQWPRQMWRQQSFPEEAARERCAHCSLWLWPRRPPVSRFEGQTTTSQARRPLQRQQEQQEQGATPAAAAAARAAPPEAAGGGRRGGRGGWSRSGRARTSGPGSRRSSTRRRPRRPPPPGATAAPPPPPPQPPPQPPPAAAHQGP